ncbi:OPT oligopeptide transporter [Meredithblackwellia eburnea MCA 4105]
MAEDNHLTFRPSLEPQPSSQTLNKNSEKEKIEPDVEGAAALKFVHDTDGVTTETDIDNIKATAAALDIEEARAILQDAVDNHQLDPNYPQALINRALDILDSEELDARLAAELLEEIKIEAALIDDSPYPEVRAVVSNVDDPEIPCSTFRVWVIGLLFAIIGTGIKTFFSQRNPGIGFDASIVQVLSTIMANVGLGGAYITYIIFVLRIPWWYNDQDKGRDAGFQILLGLSTQIMGFALAGLTRRFLVFPPAMIWPTNLAQIALNSSFHKERNNVANGWKLSRYHWFMILFLGYFFWYPVSNIAFQAITYFNWPVWIAPNNVHLAVWMGRYGSNSFQAQDPAECHLYSLNSFAGYGLNPISTFDWAFLTYGLQPTIMPLWSILNIAIGAWLWGIPIVAALWYTNTWYTGYLPLNSNTLYDRFGKAYNVTKVITNGRLDQQLYEAYSPAYQTAAYSMGFFFFFAFYTSGVVSACLQHWGVISSGFKTFSFRNMSSGCKLYNDVHNRLMLKYREVPEWWYFTILAITLVMAIVHSEVYNTGLPVWAIFLCLTISIVTVIPYGLIVAVSNVEITNNVVGEMIAGYTFAGNPLATMLFKAFAVEVPLQALGFASDQKLAHYLKLPPRTVFSAQIVAAGLSALVAIGVTDWQISNVPDICTAHQKDRLYCLGTKTFFTSSVIWGLIGPQRLFSKGSLYYPTMFGWLMGAIVPFIPYYFARRYPRSLWKYVNIPVSIYGPLTLSPYGNNMFVNAVWVALIVNGYIKRKYLAWWMKCNYVGSTALNAALALGGIVWYFILQYHDKTPNWWGNTVSYTGCDSPSACTRLKLPEQGFFGPASGWH